MIRINKLKGLFVEYGLSQKEVAEKLGITDVTLSRKLNKGVLNSDEIYKLIEIFNIQDPVDIFFADKVS